MSTAAVGERPRQQAAELESFPLDGPRLLLARGVWLFLAAASITLFVVSLPSFHAGLLELPQSAVIDDPATMRAGLEDLGLSVSVYAGYAVFLSVGLAAAFMGTGIVIFLRNRQDSAALLFSATLVVSGAMWPNTLGALADVHRALDVGGSILTGVGFTSFFLLFYLFPNGRFVPGWTRWFALAFALSMVAITIDPDSPLNTNALLAFVQILAFPGTMLFALVYRYRKVSGPVQRLQTKWVTYSLAIVIAAFVGTGLLSALPLFEEPREVAMLVFAVTAVLFLTFMFIPVSIGIAVLRYRLWDIDPIINRTLVYGALTASIVGIYVLVVGWLGMVFRTADNILFSLAGAAIVAVVFQFLRDTLQRWVNRLMYGERDEPYRVLSRLGQRLEATLAPEAVLPTIVATVRDALRLPYAAIALRRGDEFPVVAAEGEPVPNPLRLPLVYQHETVGELVLARRAEGEEFSTRDRDLLSDLARQAGIAAHAVRLAADLQHSRERLVTAREEERRRLRRDLHDGLGSRLAALNLQAGAVRRLIQCDPAAADEAVTELRMEVRSAIGDIRRLVYDLRPPALDDLGLVLAVRQRVDQLRGAGGFDENGVGEEGDQLQFVVDAPDQLPPLPAAVEVAVYRIVEEAVTNVLRHARAHSCIVRLAAEDELRLEISDDGRGIASDRAAGVGLHSMRERAEELGGTCVVEALSTSGTRVSVRLPLRKAER